MHFHGFLLPGLVVKSSRELLCHLVFPDRPLTNFDMFFLDFIDNIAKSFQIGILSSNFAPDINIWLDVLLCRGKLSSPKLVRVFNSRSKATRNRILLVIGCKFGCKALFWFFRHGGED